MFTTPYIGEEFPKTELGRREKSVKYNLLCAINSAQYPVDTAIGTFSETTERIVAVVHNSFRDIVVGQLTGRVVVLHKNQFTVSIND